MCFVVVCQHVLDSVCGKFGGLKACYSYGSLLCGGVASCNNYGVYTVWCCGSVL